MAECRVEQLHRAKGCDTLHRGTTATTGVVRGGNSYIIGEDYGPLPEGALYHTTHLQIPSPSLTLSYPLP